MKITLAKLRRIIREAMEEDAWPPGRWYPGKGEPVSDEEIETSGRGGMGQEEIEDDGARSLGEVRRKKKKKDGNLTNSCWSDYKAVGLKRKGDRMVPNCVPKDSKK